MPQNPSNLANRDIHHDRLDAGEGRSAGRVRLDKLCRFPELSMQDVPMESPVRIHNPNPEGPTRADRLVSAWLAGPGIVRMALDRSRRGPRPRPRSPSTTTVPAPGAAGLSPGQPVTLGDRACNASSLCRRRRSGHAVSFRRKRLRAQGDHARAAARAGFRSPSARPRTRCAQGHSDRALARIGSRLRSRLGPR